MFNKDIGIDLGTANVLIYIKGQGIVLNEPSVVAIDAETKKPLAVGTEAHEMLGRTPGKVKAIKPMKDGVIADYDTTEVMLNYFIKKVNGKSFFSRPRILICCPSNITQVEKNAIKEAAERTGAKKVFLEEEPKVAAVGAGMDISKPSGNMVIDIGGGTTDIAILSLGGIVNSASIRIAGNAFDNDIVKYIKDKYKLLVGERTAEDIKITIGTVFPGSRNEKMEVRGRDLVTGLPHTITLTSDEIEEALRESVYTIIHAVKGILEQTPPELSADIIDKGIVLTGGGALVDGFSQVLSQELKVPVFTAESPLTCVAEGTGILLDNLYMSAMKVKKRMLEDGFLEFSSDEVKFLIENNTIINIKERRQGKAEELIEFLMLLHNMCLTDYFLKNKLPFISRFHDSPDTDKLNSWIGLLKKRGYKINLGKKKDFTTNDIREVQKTYTGSREQIIYDKMAIMSQSKAKYSATNIGHYALGFDAYSLIYSIR